MLWLPSLRARFSGSTSWTVIYFWQRNSKTQKRHLNDKFRCLWHDYFEFITFRCVCSALLLLRKLQEINSYISFATAFALIKSSSGQRGELNKRNCRLRVICRQFPCLRRSAYIAQSYRRSSDVRKCARARVCALYCANVCGMSSLERLRGGKTTDWLHVGWNWFLGPGASFRKMWRTRD